MTGRMEFDNGRMAAHAEPDGACHVASCPDRFGVRDARTLRLWLSDVRGNMRPFALLEPSNESGRRLARIAGMRRRCVRSGLEVWS